MMAEQTTIDTPLGLPQDAPEPVIEQQVEANEGISDSTVEDAIFGGTNQDSIWAPQEVRPLGAPDESGAEQEQTQAPVQNQPPAPADNEQVRYQYWQSEADKMKSNLEEVRAQNDELKNQLIASHQAPVTQQTQVEAEPEVEEFPSAPEKPQKPSNFSRADALEDPQSDSAQYLDEVESWRDDMDQYNRLYVEYQGAMMQAERERIAKAESEKVEAEKVQSERYEAMQNVRKHITDNYQADDNVVADFIQKMSNPESVTLDNLWKLYQMEQGLNVNPQVAPTQAPPQPSPEFQQTKNAQSIPSPMGVLPSSNEATSQSTEDGIMNDLINDYNSKNPWT